MKGPVGMRKSPVADLVDTPTPAGAYHAGTSRNRLPSANTPGDQRRSRPPDYHVLPKPLEG